MGIKREAGNGFNMALMRVPWRVGREGWREGTEPKSQPVRRRRFASELHSDSDGVECVTIVVSFYRQCSAQQVEDQSLRGGLHLKHLVSRDLPLQSTFLKSCSKAISSDFDSNSVIWWCVLLHPLCYLAVLTVFLCFPARCEASLKSKSRALTYLFHMLAVWWLRTMKRRPSGWRESLSATTTRVNEHTASVLALWVLRRSVRLRRSKGRGEDLCSWRWKTPTTRPVEAKSNELPAAVTLSCTYYGYFTEGLLKCAARWLRQSCRGEELAPSTPFGSRRADDFKKPPSVLQLTFSLLISSGKSHEVLWCGRRPTAAFNVLGPLVLQK